MNSSNRLNVMIACWYILAIMLMLPGMIYTNYFVFFFGMGFFLLATAFVGLTLLSCGAGSKA
jgi:hypothetical protein